MKIGSYTLAAPLLVAPMAGVTDQPFRELCLAMGAGMAVGEMLLASPEVRATPKSQLRQAHSAACGLRSVQIVGSEPELMARAAAHNVAAGAEIIDINMGCPAKKVNKRLAGSALLRTPEQVRAICQAVVAAVKVPVTLKIRTGWSPEERNGVTIAQVAEECGIAALAVHGRTRACGFSGQAEYETIKAIKRAVSIPVIANGDIDSPQKAQQVLDFTGADAVMVGRAAQGRPWLFRSMRHYLERGVLLPEPELEEIAALLHEHVMRLHDFYGSYLGVRVARKHVGWTLRALGISRAELQPLLSLEQADEQLAAIGQLLRA